MSPQRWLAGGLGVAVSLSPGVAIADGAGPQAEPLRLSWVREETAGSCPDARAVAGRVRDRLGRDPFADSAEIAAEVVVAEQGGTFVARIRIRADGGALRGERIITSEGSCETLTAAVALALALYVDPEAALRPRNSGRAETAAAIPRVTPQAETRAGAAAPPPTSITPPSVDAAEHAAREPLARGTSLSAGWLVGADLVPGVAPAARIAAEHQPMPRVHVLLGGAFFPEQRTSDGRFGFGLAAGGAGVCVDALATAFLEVGPCLSVLAGEIHAVVYTLDPTRPGGRFWMGTEALGRVRLRVLPPLFLDIGAGAWVPFVRHRFDVTGQPEKVFQEPALAPVVDLEIGATFR
jgi:hypothetical protein